MPSSSVILASKSPRRENILKQIGIDFEIIPSNICEDANFNLGPRKFVQYWSKKKAKVIAKRISKSRKNAIEKLQNEMESILHKLGMPFANFCIEIRTLSSLTDNGIDEVAFMFSGNKGLC